MAYGLKYELKCTQKGSNDLYKLRLSFLDYVGDPVDRNIPGDSPLVLREDKTPVIRGTSLDFAIREGVDFEMDEFYTNNPKKIKAELYKATTLLWSGYNLPQQYNAPYIPAPVSINFTATDGLGLLKNEKYNQTGTNSQLAIIIYCIDKIGLALGYSTAINLFEASHNHDRSPLEQTFEDSSIYNGKDCLAVIEDILGKYDAEITQAEARWDITRSVDKKSTKMLYSTAGVYENTAAAAAVLDLGYPDTAGAEVWPIGRFERSLEPGAKSVTIKHDFGRKNSFLNNYEFWRYAGGQFTGWTQTGVFTLSQRIKDGKAYAFLAGYSNDASQGITQEIPVTNVAGEDFVFEIDFAPVGRAAGSGGGISTIMMTVRMVVAISDGVTTYYLKKTGTTPVLWEWTTTLTSISETVTASLISPVWNRIKIVTEELPVSGNLFIGLYRYYLNTEPRAGDSYSGIAFSTPLTYFLKDGELYPSSLETLAEFDNSTEPGDLGTIDLLSADAPDYANKGQLYDNITRLSDGTPTEGWHVLGEVTEYSQVIQLARALASNNRIARQKLTGTIKGNGIKFNSIIKHTYNSSREFELSEIKWDIYNNTYQVTLLELLAWSAEQITFTTELSDANTGEAKSGGSVIGVSISNDGGLLSILTADQLLAKLITVDGTGSALDADLLDGQHGSYYAPLAAPVFTDSLTIAGAYPFAYLKNTSYAKTEVEYMAEINFSDKNAEQLGYIGYASNANNDLKIANEQGAVKIHVGADVGALYISSAANAGFGFTSPLSKVSINGGLHVGGKSDAGDNNLAVDGTSLFTGVATFSADLGTASFSSGFAGAGWKMDEASGKYSLTVDNLSVREIFTAYELNINKINSINGAMIVSAGSAKCLTVEPYPPSGGVKIYFDEDNGNRPIPFVADDYIRAQIWTGRGTGSYKAKVQSVTHSATYGQAYIIMPAAISGTPYDGMDLVQIGNSNTATYPERQNMIYITASDTNNPYIDMLAGVNDGDFAGKQKLRIGNLTGITDATLGALSGYGLWSDNVYLSGKLVLPNAGMTNEGALSSSVRIYAGDTYANRATAPFNVTDDGSLTATGVAEIGTVAADQGGGVHANVAIMGPRIWENNYNGDGSGIEINTIGYNGGLTKYRSTNIGDGKGNLLFTANGPEHAAYINQGFQFYNLSQQSTPLNLTAPLPYLYICLDRASESTVNLPSSGLPGSGSAQMIFINHKYGTGLGANKYHVQGNGYKIIDAGTEVTSIDITEGHCKLLVWEPRGNSWYVVGT